MTLTYRYKSIRRPDGSVVKTPSIPLLLKGKESVEVIALLDSGADVSVIPVGIAEILGAQQARNHADFTLRPRFTI